MKTLILYASKYGATGEIARRIAEKMPEATVLFLSYNADCSPLCYTHQLALLWA